MVKISFQRNLTDSTLGWERKCSSVIYPGNWLALGLHRWPAVLAAGPLDPLSHMCQSHPSPGLFPANWCWTIPKGSRTRLTGDFESWAHQFPGQHSLRTSLSYETLPIESSFPPHSPLFARCALWSEISPAYFSLFFIITFLIIYFAYLISFGHLLLGEEELMDLLQEVTSGSKYW